MLDHRRIEERKAADCMVEMTWKTEAGEKRFEQCRAVDLSDNGVGIECPEFIPPSVNVVVWAPDFEVAALAQVCHGFWRNSVYVLGLRFAAKASTAENDPCAPDHYEILRLSPGADQETIERVYKTLAKRFHPDNTKTGNAEIFLRVAAAYRVLSAPDRRRKYDCERDIIRSASRFQLTSPDFFMGVAGEQNRRLAILCLLYRKRATNFECPGLGLLELERLTACTREELGFSVWYLCEKKLTTVVDSMSYCLTAEGVDFVESKLAGEREDFRALAAVSNPGERIRLTA